jgi:hypothetical protein
LTAWLGRSIALLSMLRFRRLIPADFIDCIPNPNILAAIPTDLTIKVMLAVMTNEVKPATLGIRSCFHSVHGTGNLKPFRPTASRHEAADDSRCHFSFPLMV